MREVTNGERPVHRRMAKNGVTYLSAMISLMAYAGSNPASPAVPDATIEVLARLHQWLPNLNATGRTGLRNNSRKRKKYRQLWKDSKLFINNLNQTNYAKSR